MGFARWVKENIGELLVLGTGMHFGEWWGKGIQKRYSTTETEKHWSLFNTSVWLENFDNSKPLCPSCCRVVPVLYYGLFSTSTISNTMSMLSGIGSVASPGCINPEGIVVYHEAGKVFFKKTFENDEGKWAS